MSSTLSSLDSFLKNLYRPEAIERLMYEDSAFLTAIGQGTEQLRAAIAQSSPLEIGIAATAAVAGLGWMIHRRNIVANDPNESLVKAFTEWCLALLNGLFNTKPKALPEHMESANA